MKDSRRTLLYVFPILAVSAFFVAMYALHPPLIDDLGYHVPFDKYGDRLSWSDFLSGWATGMKDHFLHDIGRFANMLCSTSLLAFNRIFASLLLGAGVGVCIWLSCRLAGVWKRNFMLCTLVAFFWVFALPWAGFMFVLVFGFNYVLPTAMAFVALDLFLHRRIRHWYWAFALGVFVSAWHELFGGALLCGVAAAAVLDKDYRNSAAWGLLAGLAVGLLYLYLTPGFSYRTEKVDYFQGFREPLDRVSYGVLFYLFIALSVVALSWRRWRNSLSMTRLAVFMAMAFAGWVVWRTFMAGIRSTWCMAAVSIVGIVWLLWRSPLLAKFSKSVQNALSVLMWAAMVLNLGVCLPYFVRLDQEAKAADRLLAENNGQPVFLDFTQQRETPRYLIGKPNFDVLNLKPCAYENVLPTVLEHFVPDDAESVGEGVTAYFYKGHIVLPTDAPAAEALALDFDGVPYDRDITLVPFASACGGRWLYCKPERPVGWAPVSAGVRNALSEKH